MVAMWLLRIFRVFANTQTHHRRKQLHPLFLKVKSDNILVLYVVSNALFVYF